jgi:hypothetical protein
VEVVNFEFEPGGPIGPYGGKAVYRLGSSSALPIISRRQYRIKVYITSPKYGNAVVEYKTDLFNRIVDITIRDSVLENNRANKGAIVMRNESDARITGITVIDPTPPEAAVSAGSGEFVPAGNIQPGSAAAAASARYYVYSSPNMNLIQGRSYEARVYVERGGETAHVRKTLGVLYNAEKTITVSQAEIDALVPQLPWDNGFKPVRDVVAVPSYIIKGTTISLADARAIPDDATNKTPLDWTMPDDGGTGANLAGASLTVPNSGGPIKLQVSIAGGKTPEEPFTRHYYIQVFDNDPSVVPVTNISGVPIMMEGGKAVSLTQPPVKVWPDNATNKNIVWSIKDPGTTGASIASGFQLNAPRSGTLVLTAVIPNGTANGVDYTHDFTIPVKAGYATVRLLYVGNSRMTANDNHGRWRVSGIEILRRPRTFDGYWVTDAGLTSVTSGGNLMKGYADIRWTGLQAGGQNSPADWAGKGNLLWYFGSTWRSKDNPKVSNNGGHNYIVDDQYDVYSQNSNTPNPGALTAWPQEKRYDLPIKHPDDVDEKGGDTNRKSTVYWIRLGMDNYDSLVGRWWKGYDLNTYFALDIDKHRDKIDENGVLTLYIYLYHIPYIDFWEGKGN